MLIYFRHVNCSQESCKASYDFPPEQIKQEEGSENQTEEGHRESPSSKRANTPDRGALSALGGDGWCKEILADAESCTTEKELPQEASTSQSKKKKKKRAENGTAESTSQQETPEGARGTPQKESIVDTEPCQTKKEMPQEASTLQSTAESTSEPETPEGSCGTPQKESLADTESCQTKKELPQEASTSQSKMKKKKKKKQAENGTAESTSQPETPEGSCGTPQKESTADTESCQTKKELPQEASTSQSKKKKKKQAENDTAESTSQPETPQGSCGTPQMESLADTESCVTEKELPQEASTSQPKKKKKKKKRVEQPNGTAEPTSQPETPEGACGTPQKKSTRTEADEMHHDSHGMMNDHPCMDKAATARATKAKTTTLVTDTKQNMPHDPAEQGNNPPTAASSHNICHTGLVEGGEEHLLPATESQETDDDQVQGAGLQCGEELEKCTKEDPFGETNEEE